MLYRDCENSAHLVFQLADLRPASFASRLCSVCGICCNGVMFHHVRIQSNDSPRELNVLGLKLKHKHRELFLLQPCPAYQGSQCGIYPQRPERCQLFECRLLKRVAAGELSEAMALDKIGEVVQRATRIDQLIHAAGKTDPKKPLTKRYEKIMAEPVDPASDQEAVALRDQLKAAMEELEELLEKDFRPQSL